MQSGFREHYALIFGWLLLIDIGLLAVAIARSTELLHAVGALGTLLSVSLWLAISYLPGAMLPMIGFVALFVILYLAAPKIADRFERPFEGIGEHAILVAPLLLVAFPLLVLQEPRAASPVMIFPALFALVARDRLARVQRADRAAVFHRRVLCAGDRSGVVVEVPRSRNAAGCAGDLRARSRCSISACRIWRGGAARRCSRRRARRGAAVRTVAVDVFRRCARRDGRTLGPRAAARDSQRGAVHRERQRVAAAARAGRQPRLVGGAAGVVVRSGRGRRPAVVAAGRRRPRAGHGRRLPLGPEVRRAEDRTPWRTAARAPARACGSPCSATCSCSASRSTSNGRCRRGRCLARRRSIALAFSVAALAARQPAIHLASTAMVAIILVAWRSVTQPFGWAAVAIAAFGVLTLFALGLDPRDGALRRRGGDHRGGRDRVLGDQPERDDVDAGSRRRSRSTVAAHVIGFVLLLALATQLRVDQRRVRIRDAGGRGGRRDPVDHEPHTGREVLTQTAAIYAVFAVYPLILGSRAKDNRDPYIAALIAGVWCFLIARQGMAEAGLDWMVGVVPVADRRDHGAAPEPAAAHPAVGPARSWPARAGRRRHAGVSHRRDPAAAAPAVDHDRLGARRRRGRVALHAHPSSRIAAERGRPVRRRLRPSRAQSRGVPLRAARRHAHRQLVSLHVSDRRRGDVRRRVVALEDGR